MVDRIRFLGVDLNKVDQVEKIVSTKLLQDTSKHNDDEEGDDDAHNNDGGDWFTIFIFEAVMIYLDEQVPSRLLTMLSFLLRKQGESGAICFADTLGNVNSNKKDDARLELEGCGWELQDWLPKPGRTAHLGWASLKT